MYQIKIASRKVEKQLTKLPKPNRQQILQAIQALSNAPRPSNIKQLDRNIYRLRVGNYRVIYLDFGKLKQDSTESYNFLSWFFLQSNRRKPR